MSSSPCTLPYLPFSSQINFGISSLVSKTLRENTNTELCGCVFTIITKAAAAAAGALNLTVVLVEAAVTGIFAAITSGLSTCPDAPVSELRQRTFELLTHSLGSCVSVMVVVRSIFSITPQAPLEEAISYLDFHYSLAREVHSCIMEDTSTDLHDLFMDFKKRAIELARGSIDETDPISLVCAALFIMKCNQLADPVRTTAYSFDLVKSWSERICKEDMPSIHIPQFLQADPEELTTRLRAAEEYAEDGVRMEPSDLLAALAEGRGIFCDLGPYPYVKSLLHETECVPHIHRIGDSTYRYAIFDAINTYGNRRTPEELGRCLRLVSERLKANPDATIYELSHIIDRQAFIVPARLHSNTACVTDIMSSARSTKVGGTSARSESELLSSHLLDDLLPPAAALTTPPPPPGSSYLIQISHFTKVAYRNAFNSFSHLFCSQEEVVAGGLATAQKVMTKGDQIKEGKENLSSILGNSHSGVANYAVFLELTNPSHELPPEGTLRKLSVLRSRESLSKLSELEKRILLSRIINSDRTTDLLAKLQPERKSLIEDLCKSIQKLGAALANGSTTQSQSVQERALENSLKRAYNSAYSEVLSL